MTLLAAFDIVLSRHTGSEDVVIGSTIAGRSRPEIENLIGFFINALPLRMDLSGNPSFAELLKRVREVCLDAYTHQDVPFEKIVEAINPQRELNRNPLFQIMFNVADVSERVLPLSGCEVTRQRALRSGSQVRFDALCARRKTVPSNWRSFITLIFSTNHASRQSSTSMRMC